MKGLYYISLSTNSNPPFVAGDVIRVFYNEIGDVFYITLNGSEITTGPNLGPATEFVVPPFVDPYFVLNYSVLPMNDLGDPAFVPAYQYCELTTLVQFGSITQFPYAQKIPTDNHPSCAGNVCDIIFRGTPQTVSPSDTTTPDGQITIVADSSIGVVKYGFQDVPYASMPNTTGVFTDLMAGVYTIYAKDAQGCTVTLVINLGAAFNYAVKWRLRYMPVSKSHDDVVYPTLIDILEKDYLDGPIDVKAADEAFTIRMRGDNLPLFSPIMSTECTLRLISEVNLQFLPMFTQNGKKYQLRYHKDFGDGYTELWRGWVKPGLYREPYTESENYAVEVEATDITASLSKLKFNDDNGNILTGLTKVIHIIAVILKKLGLELPIHVGDNMYETTMASLVSDDPTDQTWIIPDEVYGKDTTCDVILRDFIGSKGARIVQWKKAWWIIRIDEMVDEVAYRIFNKSGELQSDTTYTPMRSIADKPGDAEFTWINARQDLEVYPSAGVVTVRHNLAKIPNGIKNGGFDVITFEKVNDGFNSIRVTGYPGWSIILNGNTGGTFPFLSVAASKDAIAGTGENTSYTKESALANALALYKDGRINKNEYNTIVSRITKDALPNYALVFWGNGNNPMYGQDTYILSAPQSITFGNTDGMKFSFDFIPRTTSKLYVNPPFAKFKISFTLDNQYYLQADGSWSTDVQFEWIEIIVPESKYDQWQHIDIAALFPDIPSPINTTYTVRIMKGSSGDGIAGFITDTWSVLNETALRAIPTVNLPQGYKISMSGIVSGNTTTRRFYELVSDTLSPDSSPNIIHPNDYGTFNPPPYNSLATYKKGDKVKFGGSFFYVSTRDKNKNITPGLNPNDWAQIAGIVVWKLISEIKLGIAETPGFYGISIVDVNKFDNVSMEFFPISESAPDTKDYVVTNSADDIDNDITPEFAIGDAPVDINNSQNTYQNIYRTSSGAATKWWARRGLPEKQPVLGLLAKQYVEQLQKPRFKLQGDLSGFVNFIDSFSEKGRKFIPMSIEINDFNNQTSIEMIEITNSGDNNGFSLGEFVNSEFGTDFDI